MLDSVQPEPPCPRSVEAGLRTRPGPAAGRSDLTARVQLLSQLHTLHITCPRPPDLTRSNHLPHVGSLDPMPTRTHTTDHTLGCLQSPRPLQQPELYCHSRQGAEHTWLTRLRTVYLPKLILRVAEAAPGRRRHANLR